jgi:hypothetical protein
MAENVPYELRFEAFFGFGCYARAGFRIRPLVDVKLPQARNGYFKDNN